MQHILTLARVKPNFLPSINAIILPRILVAVLGAKLSTHFKRIIFVFSVYAVLARNKEMDAQAIDELNSTLKLANNTDTCVKTAKLYKKIWAQSVTGSDSYQKLPVFTANTTRIDRELVVRYYLANCPDWLWYGDDNGCDMRRDLHRLFSAITRRD